MFCAARTLEGAPPKLPLLEWGCCASFLTIVARAQSRSSLALDHHYAANPGLTPGATVFRPSGPCNPRRPGGWSHCDRFSLNARAQSRGSFALDHHYAANPRAYARGCYLSALPGLAFTQRCGVARARCFVPPELLRVPHPRCFCLGGGVAPLFSRSSLALSREAPSRSTIITPLTPGLRPGLLSFGPDGPRILGVSAVWFSRELFD